MSYIKIRTSGAQYLKLAQASPTIPEGHDWRITVTGAILSGQGARAYPLGNDTGSNDYVGVLFTGLYDKLEYRNKGSSEYFDWQPITTDDLSEHTWVIESISGVMTAKLDGVAANNTVDGTGKEPASFNALGPANTLIRDYNFRRAVLEDLTDGTTLYDYDVDNSPRPSSGNPEVIDVANGNNATAIGMPTDGTAWSDNTTAPVQVPQGTTSIDSYNATENAIDVNYSYTGSDADGFSIRINGGAAVDIGNTNPYTFTGLTPSTTYSIQIQAYNGNGTGTWSNVINATTASSNEAPTAVIGFDASVAVIGETINLNASGSTDPNSDPMTFTWTLTKPNGSTTQLSSSTGEFVTLTGDIAGTYTVSLVASDGTNTSSSVTQNFNFTQSSVQFTMTDGVYIQGVLVTDEVFDFVRVYDITTGELLEQLSGVEIDSNGEVAFDFAGAAGTYHVLFSYNGAIDMLVMEAV